MICLVLVLEEVTMSFLATCCCISPRMRIVMRKGRPIKDNSVLFMQELQYLVGLVINLTCFFLANEDYIM